MKKVLKNLKVPSSLLIFLAIFSISIFGLQVSKIYAQLSSLGSGLLVGSDAIVTSNLRVSGGVGINKDASSVYKLDVNGPANFNSAVLGVTPGSSQTNALATVAYINSKIAQIPEPIEKVCPPPVICPTCPACNSCCGTSPPADPECLQFQTERSCNLSAPTALTPNTCPSDYDLHFSGVVTPCSGTWTVKCCPPRLIP